MKKFSVKMLAMLLVVFQGIVAVSCSSDDDPKVKETPKVSFERPSYALATGDIEIKVTADVAPETNINIPVSVVSQNAKEGTDYTLASKTVTIKGGETSGTFTISRIDDSVGEDNLEMTVNLGEGDGYNLGLRNFVTVTLLGENGYIVSFTDASARINGDQEFEINIANMDGFGTLPAEDVFSIEVDPEGTTAVEGTHFTFDKSVTIAAKKNKGTFNFKLLKVEEGKDKVVLRITEKAGYAYGSNAVLKITLAGPDNFNGTWAFMSWENADLGDSYGEDSEIAPKFSSADKLTFSGTSRDEYTFAPSLTGDLKNYFGNESRTVKLAGEEEYMYQELRGRMIKLSVLKVPGVNVKFSDKESDKREAKVGFRIIEVENQEVLECTIDDVEPAADVYYGATYAMFKDWDMIDDPTHPSSWFPYRLYFSRVN